MSGVRIPADVEHLGRLGFNRASLGVQDFDPQVQQAVDHNSYLAGGYSEEFGYRLSVDQPPVFSPLEDDPHGSRLWYVQVTGLAPSVSSRPRAPA